MDWLLTQHCVDLPPAGFRRLIQSVQRPTELLELDAAQREALSLHPERLRRLAQQLAAAAPRQQLAERLQAVNAELVCWHSELYPALLREIHDPPPILYCRGRLSLLCGALLAVVGSRRPSRLGQSDAQAFSRALSDNGITVVSGLAQGIDAAAHRGALQGAASTVAVLGTGIDICYPRRNQPLFEEIGQRGLLISEFAPGTGPKRHQFPRRNRVISGLSVGVLVVEAAIHSGSLITARQALEQNREVFALPGSIHNPASRGCNALIRQGAKLVETLGDIVEEFSGWTAHGVDDGLDGQALPREAVFLELGFEPTPIDVIAQRAGLSLPELLAMLSELEVAGWVQQRAGGWQRCR